MNEKRVEKVNKVKVAEKERNNLEESKAEAELLLGKERDIRRSKNAFYQVKEKVAKDKVAELSSKKEDDGKHLERARAEMSESDAILKEKEEAYLEAKKEHDSITHEIKDTTDAFSSLERTDVKLRTEFKHIKEQMKKVESNTARDKAREEDSEHDATVAQEQVDAAKKTLADIESKKVEEEHNVEQIMDSLKETTLGLRADLETAQTNLTEAERGIASLQTEKDSLSTSIELINSRVKKATDNHGKLVKKRGELLEERKTTESKLKSVDNDRRSIVEKIAELETSITECAEEEATLQARLREAITEAEDGKALMSSSTSKSSASLQAIMKATKKGGKLAGAGVRGRLGDLASIDPKYDVAISTACGSLDSIVVDTTDGAQACIEYLRATNGGRANFIPLDRMSQWAAKMNSNSEFPAKRLFDLIEPMDDTFLPAFYQALRDTLVEDSLESATKTAFVGGAPKWRVVTLSGEFIDISGSMSGGGQTAKKGGMLLTGSSSAKAAKKAEAEEVVVDIKRLESNVTEAREALNECRRMKEEAEESLKVEKKQLKALDRDVAKMQQFLEKFSATEADISHRIEEVQRDMTMSSDEKEEIDALNDKSSGIDEQILKVSPNITSYRNAVSTIQRKILDVGGPKLARAQQRLDILTQQHDQISSTVSTREVDAKNANKNVTKYSAARQKGEEEVERLTETYQDVQKSMKEMEVEALKVAERMETANAKMAQQDEDLERFTKEYQEVKATFSALENAILDAKELLAETEAALKQESGVASAWSSTLSDLHREHLDEQNEFKSQVEDVLSQANQAADVEEEDKAEDEENKKEGDVDDEDDAEEDGFSDVKVESLPVFTEEELAEALSNLDGIESKISSLEDEKDELKTSVNMNALYQYLRKNTIYLKRMRDLKRITRKRDALRQEYDSLRDQRLKEFTAGFDIISLKLKEMYQMITLGGDAELELVDSLDPFSEGIVFSVRPPKKSWKNITNLSGGEKTLSSLALVFALHHYKPTALYVMDEIDAALDFKNVSIVANYIKERTKNAQFVIISLRNNMFELADRLVGIYKTHDCTKSVTVNPRKFDASTAGKLQAASAAEVGTKRKVLGDASNVTC